MEEKATRDRQFVIALVSLIILTVSGVVLGLLMSNPEQEAQLNVIVPGCLVVLVIFGLVAYVIVHRPLRALALRDREIQRLTASDSLTGLHNREHILTTLEREMNRAWRGDEPLASALVDIDSVAKINEQFGHDAGDGLLRSVGNLVAETCRQYDSAGRYSDAAFLVVLPGIELDDAARAAERLRQRIEASEFACHGQGFSVTVSIGVTQSDPATAESVDELLRRTDEALKRAKDEGRNRVCATTPPSTLAGAGASV